MLDSFTSALAQTLAGTLGPPALAVIAGMAIVGIIAVIKGRGWKALGLSLALFVGVGIAMVVGSAYGRGEMDVAVQAALDSSVQRSAEIFLPWGVAVGSGVVLFIGLPLIFRSSR